MVKLSVVAVATSLLLLTAEARPLQVANRRQQNSEVTGSARLLRTDADTTAERRLNENGFWSQVWSAAVADSQTTSTVDGKCRLSDGRVVPIGGYHLSKGKGKGSSDCGPSSKSSKGKSSKGKSKSGKSKGMSKSGKSRKTCAPTKVPTGAPSASPTESFSPSLSDAPTSTPTESTAPSISQAPSTAPTSSPSHETNLPTHAPTKSSMSMKKKSMMSKSTMSMKSMGKSSMMSKSSKGKGRYEDVDLPLCSELTAAPTPTPAPTTKEFRETCQGILDGSGNPSPATPTQTAVVVFVLVGRFTVSDASLLDTLESGLRSLIAQAVGCNVEFSAGGRRLADTTTDPETRFYLEENEDTGETLVMLGMSGETACLAYEVDSGTAKSCKAANGMLNCYNSKGSCDFQIVRDAFIANKDAFEDALEAGADGPVSLYMLIDPLTVSTPSATPPTAPSTSGSSTVTETGDGSGENGGGETGGGDTTTDTDRGGVVAGATTEESQLSSKDGVSTGGAVAIAGAGLLLLLLLLLLVRRGRDRKDDEPRHFEVTDSDEENSKFVDENETVEKVSYQDDYSDLDVRGDRLAHVVGEDDSQYTGNSWGNKSRIRIEPVKSVPEDTFSQPVEVTPSGIPYEDQRLHDIGQTCSSPTCKICESRRRQGASTRFVRNQKYDPSPSEADRDYISADTVDL